MANGACRIVLPGGTSTRMRLPWSSATIGEGSLRPQGSRTMKARWIYSPMWIRWDGWARGTMYSAWTTRLESDTWKERRKAHLCHEARRFALAGARDLARGRASLLIHSIYRYGPGKMDYFRPRTR